jgi:serine/threonine protein kinase
MRPDPSPLIASGERESLLESDLVGRTIDGRYEVLGLIGAGGMAEVYEVEHRGLGRRFALKLLRPELARETQLAQRFEREARAVARLQSEHIVAIVDSGTTQGGAPYFVMERLHGEELRLLLSRNGALPVARAVHLALDVCRALTVAHAAGVIHRDLKPENLFITRSERGTDLCKVLDFGVAKLSGENPTLPGTLMGTARYMAPEQIGQKSAVGPVTDLFALGAILFECLTGRVPFEGDTLERVLFSIMNEPTPSLLELRPELPVGLAELVQKALSKHGSERPESAAVFARALAAFTLEGRARYDEQAPLADLTLNASASSVLADTVLESSQLRAPVAPASRKRSSALLLGATFGVGLAAGAVLDRGVTKPGPDAPAPTATQSVASSRGPAPSSNPTAPARQVEPTAPNALSAPVRALEPRAASKVAASVQASASAVSTGQRQPAPPLFFPQDSSAPKN